MINIDINNEYKINRIFISDIIGNVVFSFHYEEQEGVMKQSNIMTNIHDLLRYNKERERLYTKVLNNIFTIIDNYFDTIMEMKDINRIIKDIKNIIKKNFDNGNTHSKNNYDIYNE